MTRSHFGTVRELPSGKFQARYLDANGRRHTAGTFAKARDAKSALAKIEAGIDRGDWIDPDAGSQTFADYIEAYLETKSADLQPTTMSGYRSSLKHLLPTFGHLRLKAITQLTVEQWWARMARAKVGTQVRRNAYTLLSGAMRAAVRWDMIRTSPCAIENGFRDGSTPRPYLSVEQYLSIVERMPEGYRVMFWLMLGAHLRLGELVGLEVGDFDPKEGKLTIQRQASPQRGGVELRETKTRKVRTIEVLEPALSMLRDHVASRAALPKTPLFTGRYGRISRSALRENWNRARAAAGLPWAHMHDVRHTGLTLVAAYATLAETMHRGGHTSANAALRYQHAAQDRDSTVARAAGAELSSMVKAG
ncbi:tyrosine recombinase XerC [Pseudolysinimonas sp.]|jgi:integrase|uniref:tyrosine recombinase XerC n=1 Tax=Pseudolysinimonas sp. TaxID=2680009 RepID=UPI003782D7A7